MKNIVTGRSAFVLTALAVAALVGPAGALAQEEAPISANVALTTDYVWRGESQTGEDPALQGGFDYEHSSGFYVGTWGSSVGFGDAELELDYYVGYGGEAAGLGYDIGAVYISYPGDSDLDWWEVYGSLSRDFGVLAAELGGSFTTDFAATDEDGYHLYLSGSVPLVAGFSLGATVGYQDTSEAVYIDDDSWVYYQVGLSTSFAGVDLDLSYHGTDVDDVDRFDDRVVFTVSKSF